METQSLIGTNPKNSMKGWYSTHEEIKDALMNNRMLNPMLDLSNACNLNCPYCYIEEKNSTRKKRLPHELTLEETISIINMFHSLGAKSIDLVGAGEPTIDPHFKEVVEHIHSLGVVTTLFTNGIKIANDREFAMWLFCKNVTVVLKWNHPDYRIQDLVAGKKGYAVDVKDAICRLENIGFNNETPTRFAVHTIAFKGNLNVLPAMHIFCRQKNIFPITGEFIPTGRTEKGEFVAENALSGLASSGFSVEEQNEIKKLLCPLDIIDRAWLKMKISKIDTGYGIKHSNCPSYYGGSVCTQALGLYVDILGNIWPCVARSKNISGNLTNGLLGNIRTSGVETIKDVWLNNDYMIMMRKNYNGGCPYKAALY